MLSQLWMLVIMIGFTMLALWLLEQAGHHDPARGADRLLARWRGCGGDETPPAAPAKAPSPRLVDFSKKPPFVNTLDIDPATGDFLLTTNKGFWRIAKDGSQVTPIKGTITAEGKTDRRHVPGDPQRRPERAARQRPSRHLGELPNFLGLMRSTDGGKTWSVVSRLADADLHKIVLRHDRLYAFDAVLSRC